MNGALLAAPGGLADMELDDAALAVPVDALDRDRTLTTRVRHLEGELARALGREARPGQAGRGSLGEAFI